MPAPRLTRAYGLVNGLVSDTRDFGYAVGVSGLKVGLPHRIRQSPRFEARWYPQRHRAIEEYLAKKYEGLLQRVDFDPGRAVYDPESPIWVFWWQGEDQAPLVVQRCIESMRKHAGSRRVVCISSENFHGYIDVPRHIQDRLSSGQITLTHFSDIVRASLLADHGGLWLDATVLLSDAIPEEVFEARFFTCRRDVGGTRFISRYRWTSFVIGGWKHHPLFELLRDAMSEYWLSESRLIDYLLIDYTIDLAHRTFAGIQQDVDAVPFNNPGLEQLVLVLNNQFSEETWHSIREGTWMHKLTRRLDFQEQTADHEPTFYGMIAEGKLA